MLLALLVPLGCSAATRALYFTHREADGAFWSYLYSSGDGGGPTSACNVVAEHIRIAECGHDDHLSSPSPSREQATDSPMQSSRASKADGGHSDDAGSDDAAGGGPGAAASSANKDTVVTIDFVPASAADDSDLVSHVAALVNRVYTDAEIGIFDERYQRASHGDIAGCIRDGHLALARLEEPSTAPGRRGVIIGCVCVKLLSPTLGDFGMLALDAEYCGGGLGCGLVRFAEEHCRKLGCTAMQLELLVPTSFEHAMKTRMQAWYVRMGYRMARLASFEQAYPALAPLLMGPTEYRIFEKDMG